MRKHYDHIGVNLIYKEDLKSNLNCCQSVVHIISFHAKKDLKFSITGSMKQ